VSGFPTSCHGFNGRGRVNTKAGRVGSVCQPSLDHGYYILPEGGARMLAQVTVSSSHPSSRCQPLTLPSNAQTGFELPRIVVRTAALYCTSLGRFRVFNSMGSHAVCKPPTLFEMELSLEWRTGAVTSNPVKAPLSRRQRTFLLMRRRGWALVLGPPRVGLDLKFFRVFSCFYFLGRRHVCLGL